MQRIELPLWPGRPPFATGPYPDDTPVIEAYLPDPTVRTGYGMLALPGGGYSFLSEKSGRQYGEWFAGRGIAVFVVRFRLGSRGYNFRAKCADAYAALSLVRAHAGEWGMDPQRIGVIGTSAGGHLAGVLCTGAGRTLLAQEGVGEVADIAQVPGFGVFCYGVLSLTDPLAHRETRANFLGDWQHDAAMQRAFSPIEAVHGSCPRAFVWHTGEDLEVSAEHSWQFTRRLADAGVPHELHLYQKGAHALGLARDEGLHWAEDCLRWITG
ncbi:alpha/beta hydrolase [Chitiniphilus purpureus]|uniref:Alpha/beta hydrolase n=1 Tax=Chitiniphilus purpureus TaxID=2981137 RepID=A0ABY6DIH1_9NEIS|nr:alpha/beta hydrolase [Chitiniphilus sp. CD1]UXY14139.1 alpha/beta hydrolase [Chitiniphilus sp. CD1]